MSSATTDRRMGLAGNTAYKTPATALASTNIVLSGEQTVGGVAVKAINAAGFPDRVLCIGQSDLTTNGLWDVSTGPWSRSVDGDGNYDWAQGSQVLIAQGSAAFQIWTLTTANPITVGSTQLLFSPSINAGNMAALAAYSGSSLVGFIQSGTGAVARTVQDKNRDTVHVNDYGGDLKIALRNVPNYTTIVLAAGNYDITGLFKTTSGGETWVGNTKAGIRLQGAGMPHLSSNGHYLTGGTVIQGTLFNLADDFEVYDLGVDVGTDVVANKYAGVYKEVFVPGVNTNYPTPQTTIKNVRVNNVITLGAAPVNGTVATYMHAALFENLENVHIGFIEAIGSYHGFVSKCINLKTESIVARGVLGDAVNFKADPANANFNCHVSKLRIDSYFLDGVEQKAGTLRYENIGNALSNAFVQIGQLIIRNQATSGDAISVSGTYPITDISFGSINCDMGVNAGAMARLGFSSSYCQRWNFGRWDLINAGRSIELAGGVIGINLGSGVHTVTGDGTLSLLTLDGDYTHGNIRFVINSAQTAAFMVTRNSGQPDFDAISFGGTVTIPITRYFSSRAGSFTLNGTNAATSGIAGFAVAGGNLRPYLFRFQGAIKMAAAGASLNIGTVSPAPLKSMRFTVPTQISGAVLSTAQIEINNAGAVTVLTTMAVNDYLFMDSLCYDTFIQ